ILSLYLGTEETPSYDVAPDPPRCSPECSPLPGESDWSCQRVRPADTTLLHCSTPLPIPSPLAKPSVPGSSEQPFCPRHSPLVTHHYFLKLKQTSFLESRAYSRPFANAIGLRAGFDKTEARASSL